MSTIKKNWATQNQIAGSGDGYITLSGTTESYSSDVDLETNGYEGAHVEPTMTIHLSGRCRGIKVLTRSS
jgi:hypothetical protein